MQAHIRQQRADQLRAHYARVYNARPSPEIRRVSAKQCSPSPSRRRSPSSSRPPSSRASKSNLNRQRSRSNLELSQQAFTNSNNRKRTNGIRQRKDFHQQLLHHHNHSQQRRPLQQQHQFLSSEEEEAYSRNYWTDRVLRDYDYSQSHDPISRSISQHDHFRRRQQQGYSGLSSEDEEFNFDNLRPEWVSAGGRTRERGRDRMKAPPTVSAYASTGDVSSVGVMTRMGSMSEKIDQFLSVVQRCEDDLREEYEFRRRRMEEKKMLARAPWAGIRRSVSSISNYSGHNNNNNKQLCTPTRSSSSNSKRKPSSSSTTHVSARSFNVSEADSPSVMRKKKKKKRPMTASATTASKAYTSSSQPPVLITERWASTPTLNRPPAVRRQATPTSSMMSRSSANPRIRGGQRSSVTATPPPPSVNIDHVQSSLRSNRNYQPPRRRRLVKKKTKVRQKDADNGDDYEDDFEKEVDETGNCENGGDEADDDDDEEEEEEDDAAGMMLFTKQWIDDQVVRGMVRQKALNEGGGSTNRGDKESSKDSAYGYSGGENSRLATREPTPDTQQQHNSSRYGSFRRRRQQQQPPPASSNRRLSGRGDSLRTTGTSFNGTSRELDSEDEKSSAYVHFVTRVTAEILRKGIFTDKSIREALDNNMRKHDNAITKKELAVLAAKLRKEFGINRGTNGGTNSLSGSMSETNLKDLLSRPVRKSRPTRPRVEVSVVKDERSGSKNRQLVASEEEEEDRELTNILYEVDLDERVVQEVLRSVKRENRDKGLRYGRGRRTDENEENEEVEEAVGPGQLRIFDAMNISNLNISFNAAAAAGTGSGGGGGETDPREKRTQQRALLINSFARQDEQTGAKQGEGGSKPKSAVNRNAISGKHQQQGRRAASAKRQDSSSSNAEERSKTSLPVKKPSVRPRPQSGKRMTERQQQRDQEQQQRRNQLPETPLHSSETPRSSSLYHPEETDEDNNAVDKVCDDDNNKVTADEVDDSEISEDKDAEEAVYASDDFDDDVDEEIDDD